MTEHPRQRTRPHLRQSRSIGWLGSEPFIFGIWVRVCGVSLHWSPVYLAVRLNCRDYLPSTDNRSSQTTKKLMSCPIFLDPLTEPPWNYNRPQAYVLYSSQQTNIQLRLLWTERQKVTQMNEMPFPFVQLKNDNFPREADTFLSDIFCPRRLIK